MYLLDLSRIVISQWCLSFSLHVWDNFLGLDFNLFPPGCLLIAVATETEAILFPTAQKIAKHPPTPSLCAHCMGKTQHNDMMQLNVKQSLKKSKEYGYYIVNLFFLYSIFLHLLGLLCLKEKNDQDTAHNRCNQTLHNMNSASRTKFDGGYITPVVAHIALHRKAAPGLIISFLKTGVWFNQLSVLDYSSLLSLFLITLESKDVCLLKLINIKALLFFQRTSFSKFKVK